MNIVKKKFIIDGMHCSSCAMNIDFDLEELEGIKSVNTSYAKSECVIEFDASKVSVPQIKVQVKKTGYTLLDN
jgi:copper chaperone CopZ